MHTDLPPVINNNVNDTADSGNPPVPQAVLPTAIANENLKEIDPLPDTRSYAERHFDPKWLICEPEVLHEEHFTRRDRLADKVSINTVSKQPIRLMKSPTPFTEEIIMLKLYNGMRERFKAAAKKHGTSMQKILECFIEKFVEEPEEFEVGLRRGYKNVVRRYYG
jgi:hypothetical protein